MKNFILGIAVCAFILNGCGNSQPEQQTQNNQNIESKNPETRDHGDGAHSHDEPGTHTHLDGTVHKDHEETPQQEEFTVSNDTAGTDSTGHHHSGHQHAHEEDGHSHPHQKNEKDKK